MDIIDKLTAPDLVEVSFHGPQQSYFEPTAANCSCSTSEYAGEESDSDVKQ